MFKNLILVPCILFSLVDLPLASITEKTRHIGILDGLGKVYPKFVLTNLGSANLIIKNITSSCGCSAASLSTWSIAPRKSAEIIIEFDPSQFEGVVSKKIYIETNDPSNENIEIEIVAEIRRPVLIQKQEIYFQDVQLNEKRIERVSIKSLNGKPLRVENIRQPDMSQISGSWKEDDTDGILEVTFDAINTRPLERSGRLKMELIISEPNSLRIPFDIHWSLQTNLTASPDHLVFSEPPGKMLRRNVIIENAKSKSFKILGFQANPNSSVKRVYGLGKLSKIRHELTFEILGSNSDFVHDSVKFLTDDPEQQYVVVRLTGRFAQPRKSGSEILP